MAKKIENETIYERFIRTRSERVCQEYISHSESILGGDITPNRVIQSIASNLGMSGMGVRLILIRAGIYKNSQEPVARTA